MIGINDKETSPILGLDLTPLIDIIFIVLVFLLLTANTQLLSLPVDVPTEATAELTPINQVENITINLLFSQPHWALDGVPFNDFSDFETAFIKLHNARTEAKIIIAADKSAPVQPLMTLLSLLQRQQITNTQILMEH
ncbi:biopolymer transporter ExbD [Shewanella sp. VB17]|uniref:ExbD/TolR family protein n=1 Tax=Shewanella sp. VB17 TaxID=2739432 RepID=UPI0015668F66|nr:biopolymer transporter ExbD [Shewanella sp. VB17]NRD73203.1 biopolymer transporter ExbD [Shewanella sp. VB17]